MSQAGIISVTHVTPGVLETLTGNSGGPVGPTGNNINVVGAGSVSVAGNPGLSTLTITVSGGGFTWIVDNAAGPTTLVNSTGYIANRAAGNTYQLPAVAAVGDMYRIVGVQAGGNWIILQQAGQNIQFGSQSSTIGVVGTVGSTAIGDSIELVCTVANTTFVAASYVGNLGWT